MDKLYGNVDMTKVMFGINAIHVPAWMVVQDHEEAVSFAGASRDLSLLYEATAANALILGELIVRPHLVIENDNFKGRGIGGFWTDMPTPEEWLDGGKILIDSLGRFK